MKGRLIKYSLTAAVGLLVAFLVAAGQGLFSASSPPILYSILSDAFFIPGILILSAGALVWIASTGFFDSLAYALSAAAHSLLPFPKAEKKSYYDYKCERSKKRSAAPRAFLYTGVAFVALSLLFLALYSSVA
ncbi:MAG: DUF3899 domain-containing protein [Clostridia bacterium]|nr:DUF3899 domain-containing protein [Clostridia bacterium]